MNTIWLIVAVMVASGVLGGIVNFFIADPEAQTSLAWWKHVVVGVVAAFMVPLFLNMISSGLIDGIRGTNGKDPDISKLFVLAGFCLVAAVSSRAFIRTISERLLQEVRDTKREVRDANKELKEAKEQTVEVRNMVVDSLSEPDTVSEPYASSDAFQEQGVELSPDEHAVLTAMTNTRFTLRSVSGLAKDTGLEKAIVNKVLSSLVLQGFVRQGLTSKGQPRWYATDIGRTALAFTKPQSEQPAMGK